MAKKIKKEEKKIEKEEVKQETTVDLKALAKKRNDLISEISSKLLSKTQLREGGSGIRGRHMEEKGYEALLPKINEWGRLLGEAPIGLGHMRKN